MHVGLANPRWGKRSRHSRRMRNPQFCVSGKRPMDWGCGPLQKHKGSHGKLGRLSAYRRGNRKFSKDHYTCLKFKENENEMIHSKLLMYSDIHLWWSHGLCKAWFQLYLIARGSYSIRFEDVNSPLKIQMDTNVHSAYQSLKTFVKCNQNMVNTCNIAIISWVT